MSTLQASLMALTLAFGGMAGLAFAMDRHYAQLTQRREAPARHRHALRWGGAALLVLAALPCVAAWGSSVGAVAWLGFLSAGALHVAWGLPYRPRFVAWAAALGGVVGLVALFVSFAAAIGPR
ncbi:DUF3325 domain-containing protein [Variovorax arabinosiphilus]|uniref:DUF3325 domain-containing protein n=1 Tax=Variovorax arabinosiphilus TaxID=3053498 RepID=UPI002578F423|nr:MULTISPECIES: DUF3325 domain-containing protein [unclassified Variovorax]MDM0119781.1 DUF3325 domain-containing protein [Variovorax sp. J2L1-78]MDM0128307.1 DUF3325 domain-containing protein [Variovorax sp. J2L1-63]MDM0232007.1 DUF3325 domain-containing protein [Variovorax sp. J2R1-6]